MNKQYEHSVVSIVRAVVSKNWKLTFSFLGSVGWFLIAVVLLVIWRNGTIVMIALVGTASGWLAGMLLAPYQQEEKRFQAISKGVSGIIAGYALGKLDKIFDLIVDKSNGPPLVLSETFIRAALMGFGCFLVAAIAVFVARTYWQGQLASN